MGASRRTAAAHPAMSDVLLDEADEPSARSGEHPAGGRTHSARRFSRPRVRRFWQIAAGLSVALVATSLVADRRETERLAALAEIPGFLAPLGDAVEERWRAENLFWIAPSEVEGRLIAAQNRSDGSVDVVGLDPDTGLTTWRTTARPPTTIRGRVGCAVTEAPRDEAPVLACVVVDDLVIAAEPTFGYSFEPTSARLLLVDTATGQVRSDDAIEPSAAVAAVEADLVLSQIDAAGHLQLRRTDSSATATRWTFTSPDPVPASGSRRRAASIDVIDGRVFAGERATFVLSAAGELLESWRPDRETEHGRRLQALPGDLIGTPAAPVAGASRTRIVEPLSGETFTAVGTPMAHGVTDSSLPELVLLQTVQRDQLVAYARPEGQPRWAVGGLADEVLVVNGRVIRARKDSLESIDGRDGSVIWTTPVDRVPNVPPVTDGTSVVVTHHDSVAGRVVLAAYRLDDGRQRWKVGVSGNLRLAAIGGELYGWSGRTVVAFG